jgi:predicted PurR-regulated permease PerM
MSDGHAPGGATDTDNTDDIDDLDPVIEIGTTTDAPRKGRRSRTTGWRSRDILRTAALVIAMYIAIQLLWFANALVLTVFMGVLFGLAVGSGVDRLERFRVPRGIGAALIVVTFFALLAGIFALMAPTVSKQSIELRRKLPEAAGKAEEWFAKRQQGTFGMLLGGSGSSTAAKDSGKTSSDSGSRTADSGRKAIGTAPDTGKKTTGAAADSGADRKAPKDSAQAAASKTDEASGDQPISFRDRIEQMMGNASHFLFRFLSSTLAVFGGLLLILFLSIYIAADPDLYRRGVLHLLPHRSRGKASEVMREMAVVLRKWLVTQLIAMAVIGAVTTVGLLVFKVKAAFALGFIAALLEFIPTVGPILSAVPAVAMGFLDSPEKALFVAILYVGIQFLENHILIPLLMKGGMDLPPALTIIAQALMALVFGFIGLLVAVPLTAAVMVVVRMLYVRDVVGDEVEIRTATAGKRG